MNELGIQPKPRARMDSQSSHGAPLAHDSARKHVTGEARYVADLPRADGQLFACVGGSAIAHGRVRRMDLSRVRNMPGVVDVITAADVPGELDIGAVFPGDPLLVADTIEYVGQPLFAVAARDFTAARKAATTARITYDEKKPLLDIDRALEEKFYVRPPHRMQRGDCEAALSESPRKVKGEVRIGGQEHFYLETQASLVVPKESGDIEMFVSTQNPNKTQVSKIL